MGGTLFGGCGGGWRFCLWRLVFGKGNGGGAGGRTLGVYFSDGRVADVFFFFTMVVQNFFFFRPVC